MSQEAIFCFLSVNLGMLQYLVCCNSQLWVAPTELTSSVSNPLEHRAAVLVWEGFFRAHTCVLSILRKFRPSAHPDSKDNLGISPGPGDTGPSWKRLLPHQGLLMTFEPLDLPRRTLQNSLLFLPPCPWGPGPSGCGFRRSWCLRDSVGFFGGGNRWHFRVAGEGLARLSEGAVARLCSCLPPLLGLSFMAKQVHLH